MKYSFSFEANVCAHYHRMIRISVCLMRRDIWNICHRVQTLFHAYLFAILNISYLITKILLFSRCNEFFKIINRLRAKIKKYSGMTHCIFTQSFNHCLLFTRLTCMTLGLIHCKENHERD